MEDYIYQVLKQAEAIKDELYCTKPSESQFGKLAGQVYRLLNYIIIDSDADDLAYTEHIKGKVDELAASVYSDKQARLFMAKHNYQSAVNHAKQGSGKYGRSAVFYEDELAEFRIHWPNA